MLSKTAALKKSIAFLLSDIATFCEHGSGLKLRSYQLEVGRAIVESVLNRRGLTFVVVFPRQSGKNELQAQIEAYLLAKLYLEDAEIVKISPTWKPQSLNAMRRLERVLKRNLLTRQEWKKEQGYIYRHGSARVFFLSGGPAANIIGATASTLLECDEAQDVSLAKWDKEISPMAASTHATRVFWGTAWTSQTLLAREKQAALQAEKDDGIRRLFQVQASEVGREVPAYASYVAEQVRRLGRAHPFIRTQYFPEESEPLAGMFPSGRRALLRSEHLPLSAPLPGRLYAFLMDVGGEDFANDPLLATVANQSLNNEVAPVTASAAKQSLADHKGIVTASAAKQSLHDGRDSSALTIVEIEPAGEDPLVFEPRYRVLHRRLWTGEGQARLYVQVKVLAQLWQPVRIVIDATGLGAGLTSFLQAGVDGPRTMLPFIFTQKSKSDLGWAFLAAVDSGRFKDHAEPDTLRLEFERQLANCQMEILPGPERRLRWGVSDGTRDALSGEFLHDDLVISAALCVLLDRLPWGRAESAVIAPQDVFVGLREVY